MLVFLLFGAIFAEYLDQECTCVEYVEGDEKKDCVECNLGCTPDGKKCRPFTCSWEDVIGDWYDQAYDITCNWNKIEHWGERMKVDNQCGDRSPKDCTTKMSHHEGGIWKDIHIYRQEKFGCAEEECPRRDGYGQPVPRGTVCSLKCRSDNADGGTRTCTQPSKEKMETCKRRCSKGNLGCADFSCDELQASWTGDFKGGRWDVCFDPSSFCGDSNPMKTASRCCNNEILGIGQGEKGSKGIEAGCEDKCTCERVCSKYSTQNGKRKCVKWGSSSKCCGAMELSLMFITIAMLFML